MTWYLPLKHLHITLAALSVAFFTARALGVLAGQAWPLRTGARWGSVAVDTSLLLAGAALWWLLALNPLHQHWLAAKLGWIVIYIVLGSLALKRAPGRRWKAACMVAALACAGAAARTALAHDAAAAWPL